ncbi:MAG: MBL fold metallo-hydrolase [Vicinamibacterales bacterium]
MIRLAAISVFAMLFMSPGASAQSCQTSPVAVQILGSGGPRVSRDRASASYLVWLAGQARILVDAGGGAYLRFGEAGARPDDLSLMAISHLHPDHVADLPALLWSIDQARKEPPLPIAGPSGNNLVPGFQRFLTLLFDQKDGAFQVLGGTVGGSGRGVPLEVTVTDVKKGEPSMVFSRQGIVVTAIGVPHGEIPALGYRVQAQGKSIVFSSDQNGTNPSFVDFARGADVLVMHLAIAAGATSSLHAAPAVVGRVAREAGVKRLVLSHIGQYDLDAAVADVKKSYAGPVTVGADLQCTPVP